MKTRWIGSGMALLGMLFVACRSAPPPPPPVITPVTAACAEMWVHMPMLITFPTSVADIDYQNREILRELVASAQARDDIRRVRVEGHTDTCGNELNNMVLSAQRAESVRSELVQMGVPYEVIDTQGFGSTQPRANENCGAAQTLSEQTNRRVEFSLLVCRPGSY